MRIYRYDTHVHTEETSPCGKVKGREVVQHYKEAGYHGIIITDHYYRGFFESLEGLEWEEKVDIFLQGYRTAVEEGKRIGLTVLMGMEIRFEENANDYLVYGIDESLLKEHKELYRLKLEDFRSLATEKGLLIYRAHPFRIGMVMTKSEFLDGIEVFNGNPRHNSYNQLAYMYAKENNLGMLSGSDFHQIVDLARGGVEIEEDVQTSSQWVEYLKEKKGIRLITIVQPGD